jgi:hypothetical protein
MGQHQQLGAERRAAIRHGAARLRSARLCGRARQCVAVGATRLLDARRRVPAVPRPLVRRAAPVDGQRAPRRRLRAVIPRGRPSRPPSSRACSCSRLAQLASTSHQPRAPSPPRAGMDDDERAVRRQEDDHLPLPGAPCTLHPAPCTLHPAPCTLHPAPCIAFRYQVLEIGTHTAAAATACRSPACQHAPTAMMHRRHATTCSHDAPRRTTLHHRQRHDMPRYTNATPTLHQRYTNAAPTLHHTHGTAAATRAALCRAAADTRPARRCC